jgi:hypothetical protein
MKFFILITTAFLFSGCVNECGVSTLYYSDCIEGYDAQGIYFKKCPYNNIYDRCKKIEDNIEDCVNCN